jgi:hypothetical protein
VHFGEGEYAAKESAIRGLLAEAGARDLGRETTPRAEQPSQTEVTPESYLGARNAARFANGAIRPGTRDFGRATRGLGLSRLRYSGRWTITPESATAHAGARLDLHFRARRVFLVLGSAHHRRRVRLLLDGRPLRASVAGPDVRGGAVSVGFERLYRLVALRGVESHTLTVVPDAGVSGYAFTFG